MATHPKKVPLAGSEREPLPGARLVGAAHPDERIEVTLVLRRRPSSKGLAEALSTRSSSERQQLSRAEFETSYGADPSDLDKVRAFAQANGLVVVDSSIPRRRVLLSGRVEDFSKAFDVKLERYAHGQGTYRGRTGPVHIPEDLVGIVTAVMGLDNRPQAAPRLRFRAETSFTPVQVAQLYDFPQGVTGQGECIAIIELGGGYRPADLQVYFGQLGISLPTVDSVSVDGAQNAPTGNPEGPDGEVMLDIEVAGAVAPGARLVVYFAPNTDAGFLDAITKAIHDSQNNPSVLSISWGSPESQWTAQSMQAFDQAFQDAAALGVTVCVASGDNGSSDGETDGLAHVDFPASSPFALGCGGTRLQGADSTITSEVVWNDGPDSASGGGISDVFDLPAYQENAKVPPAVNPGGRVGRGVPDVAGNADPQTGYQVRVDGIDTVIGGTSAVAPLWAGLVARINQQLGRSVGFLNPLIYPLGNTPAFHDITSGDNGAYQAGPGWDPCTGWGSPDGAQLAAALAKEPTTGPSGHPQTPAPHGGKKGARPGRLRV